MNPLKQEQVTRKASQWGFEAFHSAYADFCGNLSFIPYEEAMAQCK